MGALIDIIAEGITKFGGEIVGGILFAVALWMFPGLRKFFGRDKARNEDDTEAETRRQLEILQEEERQLAYLKEALKRHDEALKLTETHTEEESRRKSEIHRQLEEQRKEEARVKAEIQRKQEELRKAEEKRAEEARRKAELARQLEEKRREEERVKAEIQRRQEELRQAEARKAEESRQREEAQRQLEAMQESSESQSSDDWSDKIRKGIIFAILLGLLLWAVTDSRSSLPHKSTEVNNYKLQTTSGNKPNRAKNSKNILSRYLKAAKNGDAKAQYFLGLIYEYGVSIHEYGDGISKDINEAHKWYHKVAAQGYIPAIEALKRINAQ